MKDCDPGHPLKSPAQWLSQEKSMRKTLVAIFTAVAVVLTTVAAQAQQTIKIGLICPYSGIFADAASQLDNGMMLYVKEHGDTVAGKKLEFIRKDTGGIAPDVAKRLAQELIVRDKVDMLACFSTTPNTLAVADVSTQAKKFMVVMNAATSIVTTKSPYMVRTSFTVPMLNEALGAWAYNSGIRKAYTLVADFAPGHDGEIAFQKGFKDAGGEIVGAVRFPVANQDFTPFLQRAKDLAPDAIYFWTPGGGQPAAIGKAIAERAIDRNKIKILSQGELTFDEPLKSMGDTGLGIITALHYDANHQSAKNKVFVAAYNAQYKRNPDMFSVGAYDGMHVIYEALKKTNGDTDGEKLIAAAKGMAWESPRGPMSIDPETRDVIETVYIRRVERVNGQLVNVEFDKIENVRDPIKARMSK
jgi:branched-chain amino acid transport system substrate-binding protein